MNRKLDKRDAQRARRLAPPAPAVTNPNEDAEREEALRQLGFIPTTPAPEGTVITPENAGIVTDANGETHVGYLPVTATEEETVDETTPDGAPKPTTAGGPGISAHDAVRDVIGAEADAADILEEHKNGDGVNAAPVVDADGALNVDDPQGIPDPEAENAPEPTASGADGESAAQIVGETLEAEAQAADDLAAQPNAPEEAGRVTDGDVVADGVSNSVKPNDADLTIAPVDDPAPEGSGAPQN